jgi:hypothetical protein
MTATIEPATTVEQTPSEWLLEHFDTVGRVGYDCTVRRLFDILDDHSDDECVPSTVNPLRCRHWSAEWTFYARRAEGVPL